MQFRAKLILVTLLAVAAIGTGNAQSAGTSGSDTIQYTWSENVPPIALKTNLLYDLALVPNIGIEVAIGRHWTVGFDWFHTWISSDSRHRYWQGYGCYIGGRYYFGGERFTGHHVGAYALGMTYDVEWGGRGYQAATFGWGGGVEYGYSRRISTHFNLAFTLGLGFQDGEYKEYDPKDGHYVWQSTHKRHWWGPTRAEVSLVWMIGRKGVRR